MPRSSRSDYTASEDDNMLVQGVSGDKDGLGYFGFAYYEENQDKLKLVPIDSGKGAVTPSAVTIADGTYAPLSRPLFIYVRKTSSPLVRDFVKFYLDKAPSIASEVGYVPLPTEIYELARARWNANVIGSAMAKPGTMTLAQRYAK